MSVLKIKSKKDGIIKAFILTVLPVSLGVLNLSLGAEFMSGTATLIMMQSGVVLLAALLFNSKAYLEGDYSLAERRRIRLLSLITIIVGLLFIGLLLLGEAEKLW